MTGGSKLVMTASARIMISPVPGATFIICGPRMRANDGRAVSNFIDQSLTGEPITIHDYRSQTGCFLHADDLIDGMIPMRNSPADFAGPVNFGNAGEFTMRGLAEELVQRLSGAWKMRHLSLPLDDLRQRQPDIGLAVEKPGWTPTVDLEDGQKETIVCFGKLLQS